MSFSANLKPKKSSGVSKEGIAARTFKAAVLTVAIILCLIPIVYMILMSFKGPHDILGREIFPSSLLLDNWKAIFASSAVMTYLKNSILSAAVGTIVVLLIAIPTNFAISRLRVGGSNFLTIMLSAYIAPPVVAIIPFFILMRNVGLMDSWYGLGLLQGFILAPVAIWLLDNFFRKIPLEVDEAARVDGAGTFRLLYRIILPLVVPGLIAVSIIVFVLIYNDFLIPLMLTHSLESQTLPVGLSLMRGGREVVFGQMAATSLVGVVPVYLIAIFMQKWLVGGLTEGSVK